MAEEEQVTPLKRRKKLPAQSRPVEHAIRIREPNMSQKILDALKKRVGRSSSSSPPTKKSRGGEATLSKEKAQAGELIDLSEELTVADPSTPKVSKSKDSRGGSSDTPEQLNGGSELAKSGYEQVWAPSPPFPVLPEAKKGREMLAHYMNWLVPKNVALSTTTRAEVDLAKKDADDARVELEALRPELGEVNKKLFAAQKKITELTKDLKASDRLEDTIGTLSAKVNSLQDERTALRAFFCRLEEEKKFKDEELTAEVARLEEKVHALEKPGLELFYDISKANPQANFDYLGEAKYVYLEYCASKVAYGKPEATASTSSQNVDVPSA
ncbi:hypothetical protein CsatB_017195 [Cannabis sativa]|uniref:uncharacterized protein LOC133036041 n=1 Tax=Cannabis sativa TaxID=3483 RepID=UPI0029CA1B1B|nr:uncharacterized protein LOC133036041 [Cannabis sativa]